MTTPDLKSNGSCSSIILITPLTKRGIVLKGGLFSEGRCFPSDGLLFEGEHFIKVGEVLVALLGALRIAL